MWIAGAVNCLPPQKTEKHLRTTLPFAFRPPAFSVPSTAPVQLLSRRVVFPE